MVLCAGLLIPGEASAAAKKPGKVKIQTVKCVNANKVKVTWKKLSKNVKKYQVYRKSGSAEWKLIKTLPKSKRVLSSTVEYDVKTQFKVRAVNGKKKGKFSAVKSITIKRIKLEKSELTMENGKPEALRINNAVGTVTWTSSDNEVATVSNGTITAKKPGVVTITAKNRGQSVQCKLFVNGFIDVSAGYDSLNNFRTSPGVWFWAKDNKTKIYYNKAGAETLAPLARNVALEKTARTRAKEIATKFSHTRPDGGSCFSAFPGGCYAMGENIAAWQTDINEATEDWKETNESFDGQGHRRNMLNKEFNCVGIAGYMHKGACYWVQDFAAI